MIPAEIKRRENIAEYIIHMYQTEDLIVTYNFNLDDIVAYVIRHMTQDEEELKSLLLWYAGIIDQMKQENLPSAGRRMTSTQAIVAELSMLHQNLLAEDDDYRSIFNSVKDDLDKQAVLSGGQVSDPIQLCLNAVYGKLIINLNGKSLPSEHEKLVARLGQLLAYLTKVYHRSK
jgi:hypothetical protein